MTTMNFNKEEVRELVKANRHNHITTTYYLILKKHIKLGKISVADLSSDEYMKYINDPKNLLENIGKYLAEKNDKNKKIGNFFLIIFLFAKNFL